MFQAPLLRARNAIERHPSSEVPVYLKNVSKSKRPASKERAPERRVRFEPRIYVRPCLHVNDYTDEEYTNAWYSPEESYKMRMEIVATIQIFKSRRPMPRDLVTFRGLEQRTNAGAIQRKENKLNALTAVLDEQDFQIQGGFVDDDAIRDIYSHMATKCSFEAIKRAEEDEDEALRIYRQ